MSLAYRGKEVFKPLNTGWIDDRVACVREGYADVRLVPTSRGLFMGRAEAAMLSLTSSCLLVGVK